MFNSYHGGNHTVEINAVTGAILKNHPQSWFERFHLKSKRAEDLLTEGGHQAMKTVYNDGPYRLDRTVNDPDKNIIVLQMMICGDMEVLAECVYAKDYNSQEV